MPGSLALHSYVVIVSRDDVMGALSLNAESVYT